MPIIPSILYRIICFGHDFSKGPIPPGMRKTLISWLYWVTASVFLVFASIIVNYKSVEFDYSHYLGPDYKNSIDKTKRISTMVTNHVSWLDPVITIK